MNLVRLEGEDGGEGEGKEGCMIYGFSISKEYTFPSYTPLNLVHRLI